jgi:hypothetical protein
MVGFYTFQGFQGYKIYNFWIGRLISMVFRSCSKIERKLNLFDFQTGHVAVSYWEVMVRPDRVSEPWDLSLI